MDARFHSTRCWVALKGKLKREYIRMMDEGGQAGTEKFKRTGRELHRVDDIILKRVTFRL